MRHNYFMMILAAGMLCTAIPAAAAETELQTEAVTEQETETAHSVQEEITALAGIGEVSLVNDTDSLLKHIAVRKAFEEEWITEEKVLAEFAPEAEGIYDIRLETEDGDVLVYPGVMFESVSEIHFYETEDAVYTVCVDTEEEEISQEAYPVAVLEEAAAMYTLSRLNVRALPSTEGEKLDVLDVAAEVTAYGELEGWYLIRYEDAYAYVAEDYLTEDQALAQQKAEEIREAERLAAEEAARIAAQQQAQQSQQPQYQAPSTEVPSTEVLSTEAPSTEAPSTDAPAEEVYEVSRENVPGCDDPSHGITYITYSDGSVVAVPY